METNTTTLVSVQSAAVFTGVFGFVPTSCLPCSTTTVLPSQTISAPVVVFVESDNSSEASFSGSENVDLIPEDQLTTLSFKDLKKHAETIGLEVWGKNKRRLIIDIKDYQSSVRPAEPTHVKCIIDLELKSRDQCIICPEKHALSKEHLVNMIDFTCSKSVDEILEHEGKIKCPVPGCEYHYSHWEVANSVTEKSFGKYMDMVNRVQYQHAFVQIAEDIEEQRLAKIDAQEAEDNIIIQEAIRNQFRNTGYENNEYGKSFKCPVCAFGPIDKFECDDLETHHGEVKADGISISNACPMCGYFAQDVTGWSYWDGTFLQGKRMRDTKKIIDNVFADHVDEKKTFMEERDQIIIKRNRAAASLHPLAKILDKINPNRYVHYGKNGLWEGEICPANSENNFANMYIKMKEFESEEKIREFSVRFQRRLIYSLRHSMTANNYALMNGLNIIDDQLYNHDQNYGRLARKMCDQIKIKLKDSGYETPVVWAIYDDEEEDSYDSY